MEPSQLRDADLVAAVVAGYHRHREPLGYHPPWGPRRNNNNCSSLVPTRSTTLKWMACTHLQHYAEVDGLYPPAALC